MRAVQPAVLVLALLAGAATLASAATVRGTQRPDRLVGTARADAMFGLRGSDRLFGRGGGDLLVPGAGRDFASGGAGNDRFAVEADTAPDVVSCGAGRDVVTAGPTDRVRRDCEVVSVQLSRDPYRNPDSEHETQVEPDSFAYGSTIVTVFQSGRFVDGAASNIGFATSHDAGRSWRAGFLPGLSRFSSPPGDARRVSDPVIAYDAIHGVWLAASLALAPGATELLVSRSRDGLAWGPPVTAARAVTEGLAYDKEWIACDNWPTSPYRGRCYLSYTDIAARRLSTQYSADGGLTWSRAAGRGGTLGASGVQPVARPDGSLVVVYIDNREGAMRAIRSADGGTSFTAPDEIAQLRGFGVRGLRAPPLPSVEVAGDGRIYAAWQDCRFTVSCARADIVLASSADGRSWTRPRRVPVDRIRSSATHFVPGLAVDPASRGARTRLAIAYHSLRPFPCAAPRCRIDVSLISSENGGRTWSRPQRLTAQGMRVTAIVPTTAGRMLGDYISTSFVGGRAVPVFSLASERRGDEFRQAIFATVTR